MENIIFVWIHFIHSFQIVNVGKVPTNEMECIAMQCLFDLKLFSSLIIAKFGSQKFSSKSTFCATNWNQIWITSQSDPKLYFYPNYFCKNKWRRENSLRRSPRPTGCPISIWTIFEKWVPHPLFQMSQAMPTKFSMLFKLIYKQKFLKIWRP